MWRLSEASSQVLVAQHSWKHTCEGESYLLGWLSSGLKPGRAQPYATRNTAAAAAANSKLDAMSFSLWEATWSRVAPAQPGCSVIRAETRFGCLEKGLTEPAGPEIVTPQSWK